MRWIRSFGEVSILCFKLIEEMSGKAWSRCITTDGSVNSFYALHGLRQHPLSLPEGQVVAAVPDTTSCPDLPALTGSILISLNAYSSVTEANFSVMF